MRYRTTSARTQCIKVKSVGIQIIMGQKGMGLWDRMVKGHTGRDHKHKDVKEWVSRGRRVGITGIKNEIVANRKIYAEKAWDHRH